MGRIFLVIFLFVLLFFSANFIHQPIFSDELDDINKKISELQQALEMSRKATLPLETQVNNLQKQLSGIEQRVSMIEADLASKRRSIEEGYRALSEQKELFNKAVRAYYIKSYFYSPFLIFVASGKATDLTKVLAYQKKGTDQDKEIITTLAIRITDLEEKKIKLEEEEKRLKAIKEKVAQEKGEIEKIVKGAKSYQATLSSEIAKLTVRQQEILGQRLAALNIPRSAATAAPACVDDRTKDPGFAPRFAFFTYGVPNRTGLNQYGAWGRAKAQQGYEDILRAYYNFDSLSDIDQNIQIHVVDSGIDMTLNIEEYVKRIYEMPDSWTENNLAALKAQVIAARSYALAYTNNGQNSICASQKCQVFQPGPKGGNWEQAVITTAGKVMVQGGQPIKAWYSSTHGGYILASSELPGWQATSWTKHAVDTTTGSAGGFSDLASNAYDKDSPWFYCDWGSRTSYNKTAWLKAAEAADIVNVILLARADSSTGEHLYQTDKPHPYGEEVWGEDRVRQELQNRGITPFNNISDISLGADFSGGRTTSVNVSGDAGSQSFSGTEFKDWFNLRAPANIQIVGPLYNIER